MEALTSETEQFGRRWGEGLTGGGGTALFVGVREGTVEDSQGGPWSAELHSLQRDPLLPRLPRPCDDHHPSLSSPPPLPATSQQFTGSPAPPTSSISSLFSTPSLPLPLLPPQMVRAWIFNEGDPSDQREPHFTNPIQWISIPHLQSLGVSYWHLPTVPQDAIDHPTSGPLGAIRTSRHYKNHDVIKVSPATLPNYEEKIQMFYREHLHEDEEIRYVLDGTGYFDVRRDKDDKWIRIEMSGGDMIVLPAGMYHRYTNDVKDFVHVMRLFKDNPKWCSPHSHIHPHTPSRTHPQLRVPTHSPLRFLSLPLLGRPSTGALRPTPPPRVPPISSASPLSPLPLGGKG